MSVNWSCVTVGRLSLQDRSGKRGRREVKRNVARNVLVCSHCKRCCFTSIGPTWSLHSKPWLSIASPPQQLSFESRNVTPQFICPFGVPPPTPPPHPTMGRWLLNCRKTLLGAWGGPLRSVSGLPGM